MFKDRKFFKPRIAEAEKEFVHVLNEAALLFEALILQQTGTNAEKVKNLDIKKASINELNAVLVTLKSLVKKKLAFTIDLIDEIREECLKAIIENNDFGKTVKHSLDLNLIADNNDITLYLAPYVEYWTMLDAGVKVIILNHIINSINADILRASMAEQITKNIKR